MRSWCPNPECRLLTTQHTVYIRVNSPSGKRKWVPVGYICSDCGHFHKDVIRTCPW